MSDLENNPIFKSMSQEKQNFILEFQKKEKPLNQKETLPFILKYINMAKQKNISFSREEILLLYSSFENQMSPMEKQKLSTLLSMIK